MFGIWRRGVAPAVFALFVPAVATLLLSSPARAGELEARAVRPSETLFGTDATKLEQPAVQDDSELQAVEQEKLWAADYHPETDRWTERNNRVKITLFPSAMAFAGNMRIQPTAGAGLRVSWEVPGFIGIRLDSTLFPEAKLRVRNVGTLDRNGDHHRLMSGIYDLTSLSVAIFNPELSWAPGLAMWAGFGLDLWSYHFTENISGHQYQYIDYNAGGNFFFNLEYRIIDIFHVGIEFREHAVYAPQVKTGEFYKVDGIVPGIKNSRAQLPISAVEEIQLHLSILF